MNNDK